jgi:SAM-dependent methyltransferase
LCLCGEVFVQIFSELEMRAAHKIAKLVDGTAWLSASNAYHRWRHPIDPQDIIKEIDSAGFAQIREKFSVPGELTHWPKYLDADRWLSLNIRRAQELRLTARPRPLRILDLGSGAGWFLLVARHLGHSGVGLDIPDPPMYGELFDLFGLKRTVWEIKAYQPLPDLGERFDMVTAFSICFNGHKRSDLWTSKEWSFFLDDLQKRFLRPDGEIFLGMNPEEDGSFYTPALRQFFIERGAQIDRAKVWFKKV